ncbi:nicotinate phosphoribosyltransferase [Auritidibacter ignavus]|nr:MULTISPECIES: nicotinate phosphoribosyltransferase [Auritidibacter]NIH70992.1 nicotinate phosphoribosyltransferase [Auritidibacter ignavus]WGH81805.1 nicotinate phosphoribosyltransferase [Auritidibacter ignavus]WGH86414.1 nicotinate phosphoribosyltransferase [Auritidibacter ignavus]WGH88698.1 nicotinate phosphoribosyltransferase [Auritidibacter ignavus]
MSILDHSETNRGFWPSSLFTDHYELTMLDTAMASGAAHRPSIFELFARRLPEGRRYGVVAGTGRFLEGLKHFRFTDAELGFLSDHRVVTDQTLAWLADFTFSGTIYGYPEGEVYFPHSPILQVEATFAEACLLETYALSILNYDSAVASAASRMVRAAGGRPCIEMGSRRTHEESAVAAARAAYVAGFGSTSNLEAGARYGIPTGGTAAHSLTLLHDTEREAFQAQVDTLGPDTTLLVDTYDIAQGVRTAVEVAGPGLGKVRIDSGDLIEQAHSVRELLDELGNTDTGIMVTSDLDEYAIAGLRSAPVSAYGVGTKLVTGSGAPTASMVYKLTARAADDGSWHNVAKASQGKKSVGGRKYAARQLTPSGVATAELLSVDEPITSDQTHRDLVVKLVDHGEIDERYIGQAGVQRAVARHRKSLAELPRTAFRLQAGDPVIPSLFQEIDFPRDR